MLKLRPSLKLRAAGAFIVSYVAIFVGMLVLMTVGPDVAAKNRLGPNIALSFAADELRRTHGVVQISEDGRFRRLSSKNPSLWLIGQADGQRFSFGSVPPQAHALAGPVTFGGAIAWKALEHIAASPRRKADSMDQ